MVPAAAEAEVMFRTVGDADDVRRVIEPLASRVAIEHLLTAPVVHLLSVPGFEQVVLPYTTDIPFLSAWGRPLLFGPGSVLVAHAADEHVRIPELEAAVGRYVAIARHLLAGTAI